ncbi:MAG TPA: amino acid adenylation domain-containing protein [Thermoanaerobaculia bacterium]
MAAEGVEDIYPLSPLQQGILFHALYAPEAGFYFQQLGWQASGDLDRGGLRRAWARVVERHAVLRSAFAWEGRREALQVVSRRVALPWSEVDWSRVPPPVQQARLDDLLAADRRAGFRLDRAPLSRLCLMVLGGGRYRFLWSYHHLVLDGWSVGLVLDELFEIYLAERLRRPARQAAGRCFGEYIAWLRRQDRREAEAFWRRTLAGMSTPPALGPRLSFGPERRGFSERIARIGQPTTDRLQQLARQSRTTLNVVVQAAWSLLLGHYTGASDLVFGATLSGRSADPAAWSNTVGVLVNTVPVRVRLPAGTLLSDWLRHLQEHQAELFRFEHTPLVDVQSWSEVPAGKPLFDSLLAFENFPAERSLGERGDAGLSLGEVWSFQQPHYPLALMAAAPGDLSLRLLFDLSRFDAATAGRLLEQLAALLAACAGAASRRIEELSPLTAAERHQLLVEWNDTAAPDTAGDCLHTLFARQAERSPAAVAVDDGELALTYGELETRANQLAHLLIARGVGAGDFVAVLLERGAAMAAALLGILKAGAAYVPIEPAFPPPRLRYILDALAVRAAVASAGFLPRLAALQPELPRLAHLVPLGGAAGQPCGPPPRPVDAGALAYVIFTSGSTGNPKGVAVRHRQAVSLVRWVNRTFAVGASDRLLQTASLGFDLSVYDLFGLLAAGGSLRIATAAELAEPARLADLLLRGDITFWDSAPAALQQLAPLLPERPAAAPLRLAFLSGDWVPLGLAPRLRAAFPAARVIALGGATEAVVWSNFFPVGALDPRWVSVPYGRPIDNARYHVLDARGEPCAIGVEGDLYIGGDCLAWGYWSEPALTAERFLPDPFAAQPGAVVYRTGDRARYLPDGNLEFLGRRDQQVKVRGYRIETGEVEAALLRHDAVREVVVVARGEDRADKELVAYFVAARAPAPAAAELRDFAAERLPHYMVPAHFVALPVLPTTVNGKLDRKALPDPTRPAPAGAPAAGGLARTPTGELMAAIWEDLLGLDAVGPESDFFALGGHSVLATQLVSRLRRSFGVEMPLRTLFDEPTLAGLTRWIDTALLAAGRGAEEGPLPVPRQGRLPLSFAQQRLWFVDRLQPGSAAFNIPVSARLLGGLDVAALRFALAGLVRRHEVLRSRFPDEDGEPQQVISPAATVPLPEVNLAALPASRREAEALRLAAGEAARRFDLARGPLLRAALVRLAAGDQALLLTLHHIVADGWSLGLLLRELSELYRAAVERRPPRLAGLAIQYVDFAAWQRRSLTGETLERQLSFWRERLGGDLPVLALPVDGGRQDVAPDRGAQLSLPLPPALGRGLRTLARQRGATLTMALMALLAVLLRRLSGQDEVILGLAIANRSRVELEPLIGLFLNTLPIRIRPAGDSPFHELLAAVREGCLAAYAHQDLPFETLVAELRPERQLDRHPVFDVLFNTLNVGLGEVDLPGLEARPLDHGAPPAKFALTLYVHERREEVALQIVYRAARWSAARAASLADQLLHLLAQAVEAPARAVGAYSLVTPAAAGLLPDLAAPLDRPAERPAADEVDLWCARSPHAAALRQCGREWSYAALGGMVRGVERRLRQAGVAAGDVVALRGPRCPGLVAGFVGVLRAGCVLLTLDPALPEQRQRQMLELAGARLLLDAGGEGDPRSGALPSVVVHPVPAGGAAPAAWPPGRGSLPADAAYVFFTSGTSGEPKAVLGSHRGLSHFLRWQRETFGIGPGDRSAQLTALSFDVVLRDVLLPLTSGATLCLPDPEAGMDGERLLPWLVSEGITVLHTVPALARSWLAAAPRQGAPPVLPALRRIFFAGEPLDDVLVGRWRALAGTGCAIVNLYGPTETTLARCYFEVPLRPAPGVQPVGRPLPQSQAVVMTPEALPCGLGEPGEIVLRTPLRSHGYLDGGASPPRFIRNPMRPGDPDDLLYRTGDRGRYLLDGTLEILGRMDDQLKVRGVRVEPAEVAAVLARHPAVVACVVVPWSPDGRDVELAAYVVARAAAGADAAALRVFLAGRLHSAMVPARILFVDRLATTANGKVDRRSLPPPDAAAAPDAVFAAPETATEQALAAVWAELLGAGRVGRGDDFFQLGGHSLLAARLASRVAHLLGVDLPLRTLFERPRLADLARAIDGLPRQED